MIHPAIIEAVKRNDKGAFKELYKACIPYVCAVTKRYVSNESDIADIIQEIFARVFLSLPTYQSQKGSFKPWLRRLIINECFQKYRKEKKHKLHIALDNAPEIEDKEIGLHELSKEEIESLLQKMPEGYRQVFLLNVIDEYNHKEIGALLEITPEASRSQLSRAKKWLRNNGITKQTKTIANGF